MEHVVRRCICINFSKGLFVLRHIHVLCTGPDVCILCGMKFPIFQSRSLCTRKLVHTCIMALSVWARNVLSSRFFLVLILSLPFPGFSLAIVESRGSHCALIRCLSVGLTSASLGLLPGQKQVTSEILEPAPKSLQIKLRKKCLDLLESYVYSTSRQFFRGDEPAWVTQSLSSPPTLPSLIPPARKLNYKE